MNIPKPLMSHYKKNDQLKNTNLKTNLTKFPDAEDLYTQLSIIFLLSLTIGNKITTQTLSLRAQALNFFFFFGQEIVVSKKSGPSINK